MAPKKGKAAAKGKINKKASSSRAKPTQLDLQIGIYVINAFCALASWMRRNSSRDQNSAYLVCLQDNSGAEAKLPALLQQKLLMVQSYWDTLSTPQRQQLLIIDVETLKQWAYEVEEKADRQPGKLWC